MLGFMIVLSPCAQPSTNDVRVDPLGRRGEDIAPAGVHCAHHSRIAVALLLSAAAHALALLLPAPPRSSSGDFRTAPQRPLTSLSVYLDWPINDGQEARERGSARAALPRALPIIQDASSSRAPPAGPAASAAGGDSCRVQGFRFCSS